MVSSSRNKKINFKLMLFSFADLYERAVRNLLNIRPLFDSSMDLFGPKSSEANTQDQFAHQNQARHLKQERGPRAESRDAENGCYEAQNHRVPNTFQPAYLTRVHEKSSKGFFAQALSEHARFSQNRQSHSNIQQRHTTHGLGHSHHRNGQVGPNNRTGQVGGNSNGCNQNVFKGSAAGADLPQELKGTYDQHSRYWQSSQRHKPSMFDDLRYHAKLVLTGELITPETSAKEKSKDNTPTEVRNIDTIKQEVPGNGSIDTEQIGVDIGGEKKTKLSEKEQLDLIRERIIKENQKLKYRPYSLRSKRNNLKKGRKQSRKNRIRKKAKLKHIWKPSTPQEIFLHQFGLVKKIKDELDVKEITVWNSHLIY